MTTQFDSYPGLVQFSVIIDNYGIADGNYFYFTLPAAQPMVTADADQRALPLLIPQGNKNTVTMKVNLPADYSKVLIAPRSEHFAAGAETARLTTKTATGGSLVTGEYEVVPAIVGPAGYQAMLNMESALDRRSSKVFLLEQK